MTENATEELESDTAENIERETVPHEDEEVETETIEGITEEVEKEIKKIDGVLNSSNHPFMVVLGGKKVDDKINRQ